MTDEPEQSLFLGLESGGRKIAATVIDRENRVLARAEDVRNTGNRAEATLAQIEALAVSIVEGLPGGSGTVQAVGWGFGGMVDRELNQPHVNPHEEGWEGLQARALLESALSLPVYVVNDCNAAALAEGHCGAGSLEGNMIYMTVGSGIGGGVLVEGHLFSGGRFGEVEIGHLPLDPEALPCPCGNLGCVESSCSGDGLGRLALHWRERFLESSELSRRIGSMAPSEITPLLFDLQTEDPLAEACRAHLISIVGKAGAILANLFNPSCFVLGGGVMQNTWLLEPLQAAMHSGVAPPLQANFPVVAAALNKDVVPLGAALYARQCIFEKPALAGSLTS